MYTVEEVPVVGQVSVQQTVISFCRSVFDDTDQCIVRVGIALQSAFGCAFEDTALQLVVGSDGQQYDGRVGFLNAQPVVSVGSMMGADDLRKG